MKEKDHAVSKVLLLIFFCFVLLIIFSSYVIKTVYRGTEDSSYGERNKGPIAVIEVSGLITSAQEIIELLHGASLRKDIKAILLRIDSPGGAVGPVQEIFYEIRQLDWKYKESKGKEGRPVYASFGNIATSGGYYIGAAARKIFANPGTITGSIGVMIQLFDASEFLKWLGVRPESLSAGRYKTMGYPHRGITHKERSLIKKTLEGVRRQFVHHVKMGRKGRLKGNIEDMAQGQFFSGEEAFELGLIDELGGIYVAGRKIHKELQLKEKFGLQFIRKKEKNRWVEFMTNFGNLVSLKADFKLLLETLLSGAPLLMFK